VGRGAVAAIVLVLAFGLTACGQIGSPELARRAANDFLGLLAAGDAAGAWAHLTPGTRAHAYDNDMDSFVNDVEGSDWSGLTWQIEDARDHDVSWGVNVRVDESSVPVFLLERRIVGGREGTGIIDLNVQFASREDYLIVGPGLS
jgi:hypothetical protein